MTVIDKVKLLLEDYPEIATVCNAIHVDFLSDSPTNYGLSSIGDRLVSEDVLGNQTRAHAFLLHSTFSGINDFERLNNSDSLLGLAMWLDGKKNEPITGGRITKISASNGMLYAIPQENEISGIEYQLQITAEYKINA